MYRKAAATAVTMLLTVVTGCPATAQQLRRVVSYHDLDLARPAGARELRRRLTRAVNYVCRFQSAGDELLKSENQQCREEVMADVAPKAAHAIELAQARAATSQFAAR